MASPKRLFLIDGMAQIYRSHFAMIKNPLITKDGRHTSAIFGFMNSLFKLLREENPDYIAVVLDSKSHKKVASLATFPKIRSHHVTIAFSPDEVTAEKLDAMVDDIAGKDIRINTSEYMKSDEIDALVVSGMSGIKREDPGQAHITVSHKEGVKPEKSKEMVINPEIKTPKKLSLSGKFQFIALK